MLYVVLQQLNSLNMTSWWNWCCGISSQSPPPSSSSPSSLSWAYCFLTSFFTNRPIYNICLCSNNSTYYVHHYAVDTTSPKLPFIIRSFCAHFIFFLQTLCLFLRSLFREMANSRLSSPLYNAAPVQNTFEYYSARAVNVHTLACPIWL